MTFNTWVAGRNNRPGLLFGMVGNLKAHPLGRPENNIACTLPAASIEDADRKARELARELE